DDVSAVLRRAFAGADCAAGFLDSQCGARGSLSRADGFAGMPGAPHAAGGASMKDERLIVLLDAFLDGVINAEGKKELERMLLESDAARREFWRRASLHGWTHAAAKVNYGSKPAEELARARRALQGVSIESFISWLRRTSQMGWKVVYATSACAAALVMW